MAKFFSRLGKNFMTCSIRLSIHKVEADVSQPLNMSLFFVRGPQRDESNRFEITPSNREADINQTFSRDSSFYQEKNGALEEKKC